MLTFCPATCATEAGEMSNANRTVNRDGAQKDLANGFMRTPRLSAELWNRSHNSALSLGVRMKPFAKSFCAPSLFTVLFALLMSPASVAQVAGQNVNMVSGTQWPKGDPFLQRQNEPSMAVSTRNPMHILAGSNDYRSVDLDVVLSGGAETGDSWLGLFKSFDGGLTWQSTLLPGCPQAVPQCTDSGALGGRYQAASDPVVRAGTNGMSITRV